MHRTLQVEPALRPLQLAFVVSELTVYSGQTRGLLAIASNRCCLRSAAIFSWNAFRAALIFSRLSGPKFVH